jgi:serine phosphatase RsbU (regulator of sigma subunit)
VGGDTFDFAVERDSLHLSITDAMGHTVQAAVLATVLVGALRNARRAGVGLAEQAQRANAALCEFVGRGEFVTGQVARIDLNAATATIVNAGHPPPLRLRDGHVEAVSLPPDLPFGTARDTAYRVQQLSLLPGDRLVLLTDGMLDRNAAAVDIDKPVIGGAEMHRREAVQHLVGAVLHATDGELADDATVMCFDWHGGPTRHRTTDSGANR